MRGKNTRIRGGGRSSGRVGTGKLSPARQSRSSSSPAAAAECAGASAAAKGGRAAKKLKLKLNVRKIQAAAVKVRSSPPVNTPFQIQHHTTQHSNMATEIPIPSREPTPSFAPSLSSIPQKRALEDDHQPAVSSPLNPDFKANASAKPKLELPQQQAQDDTNSNNTNAPFARDRAPRAKKESLKKRESNVRGNLPESARATPDPKASATAGTPNNKKKLESSVVVTPQRFKLPPPKLSDFDAPREPIFTPSHTKTAPDGSVIQFNETSDHVLNKKLFHYTQCVADPAFQRSNYYRRTDPIPFGPAISVEDASTHMFFDESMSHVTTDKGWRMAKGNVCVRNGRYYWECKITSGISRRKRSESQLPEESKGHVRMGWARREATLDAPVGFDAYSYALRDVSGQKVFLSRPQNFFPPGEDIKEGDVIGLEISLPSLELHRKVVDGHYNPAVDFADDEKPSFEAADIIRDRVPIRFKTHTYFEQVEYHSSKELEELMNPSPIISSAGGLSGPPQEPSPTHPQPALRTLPGSNITIYKNGKLMGVPFKNLLSFLPPASKPHIDKTQAQIGAREGLDDGMLGYYPAISVFRGGAAEVNLGPRFWFPPPDYEGAGTDTSTGNGDAGAEEEDVDEVDMIGSPNHDHTPAQPPLLPNTTTATTTTTTNPPTTSNKVKPISERFEEQIVEDIVWDLIDEVDFWRQDGMPDGDVTGVVKAPLLGSGVDGVGGFSAVVGGAFEAFGEGGIKELVQDDE